MKQVDEVGTDEMILDIGPVTAREWAKVLNEAKTILWNGPIGVFEYDQFGEGTRVLAEAVAESSAFSLAGGGDTIAALEKYGVASDISYISTGGGAFLEMIEGKKLPGVEILREKQHEFDDIPRRDFPERKPDFRRKNVEFSIKRCL